MCLPSKRTGCSVYKLIMPFEYKFIMLYKYKSIMPYQYKYIMLISH
jgi:hypothetical protein